MDSVRQLLSAHETLNQYQVPTTHNPALPTTRSDGFLWTTTSSCYCNTLYQAKITPVQAVTWYILATASRATAAAGVLIPGSTSTHMKVNAAATFGQKMSPIRAYFTKLHRRFRPRDEPGQERHAACIAEMARSVVCTPTTVPRL